MKTIKATSRLDVSFPFYIFDEKSEAIDTNKFFYVFVRGSNDEELIKKKRLKEWEQFCFSDVFNKKIIVVYGNCHTIPIIEQLKEQTGFRDRFIVYPVPYICNIKSPDVFKHPAFTVFCNIFVHQAIREENAYGIEYASNSIIASLPDGCEIIAIPNLHKMPKYLFPQANSSIPIWSSGVKAFNYDQILSNYIKGHLLFMKPAEYRTHMDVLKHSYQYGLDNFLNKLELRDRDWDVKISDYISANINRQLFYDPNHPKEEIINHICMKLCERLGLQYVPKPCSSLDAIEMPSLLNYDSKKLCMRKTGQKYFKKLSLRKYIFFYTCLQYQDKELGLSKRLFYKACLDVALLFPRIFHKTKQIMRWTVKEIKRAFN